MNYEEALAFVHGRPRLRKAPTLKRMRQFLTELGNPQTKIQAVHVAGTNGKGSTIAFLTSLLGQEGRQVGTFTSPFITRFNERIAVNGQPISDEAVANFVTQVRPVVEKMDQTELGGPLEFEIVTAMMFLYFAQHPVDVVLVEVGIGGLYDSTNVFTPLTSVIINVGWDHMALLGNTLPEIAQQKAGIIKPHVPVVTGVQVPEALTVIKRVANEQHAPLMVLDDDFKLTGDPADFESNDCHVSNIKSGLLGVYQLKNLAVAIQAAIVLSRQRGWKLSADQIRRASLQARWPGRMEIMQQAPLVVLDGAHNLPGVQALKQSLQTYWQDRPIHILAAILDDKLFQPMIDELLTIPNAQLTLTNFQNPLHRQVVQPAELVANEARQINYEANWRTALRQLIKQANPRDVVIITGSLYFVSEVRPLFKK
ncbi:bifunctional folylpolyglutamate synthase/dihydrofolate synthase [Pediococcus acidilactici]|uniref:bifunctional folylpolyglutamate synthase/dihydrofolate synthase n=1 Tax=Pediococcus acidilactici TaxID=1254 RepID=UPI00132B3335|nr:folylpolyglutamate synthase/dihydrofolate synthase family protein [Pediococcus acidilactici]KAF0464719.1 bifunctional folylpolyglutamate synthase/dihydrofolate synthase [Pediococcus acidilactici]KAF0471675.1 bifunctional folylpolyglutamate synthase/dihydrofolate synthase [Pediococcus acidilactici]KAF0489564.1 bifunctional folylpolyglutamate synthase/dihydrofolate synthase [Pediococcus acidilactici]KAF0525424.1 bifunctional folylpolyglutamate synthase/dihydrofolate synthase [Pediococcus acidi